MLANNSQQKQIILPVLNYPVIISSGQKINASAATSTSASVIGTLEQPQKCHLCQKDFPSMMAFQTHVKDHHLDGKMYRNIIAVTTVNSPVSMIPAQQHHYQIAANNTVKIEKDYQPMKSQTIIHTSDVLKQAYPTEFATVANLNITPVIQQIQIQQQNCDSKDNKQSVVHMKQNPVEYHIQQQQHAAMVVAQMNQKSGISASPFLNSTIKYELHGQPVQLVTEVYPQMITETAKSDDMNSQSSVSSPASSVNIQTISTASTSGSGPILSNGETMDKQHKCLICDKFFTTVANLNIHLKCHAGDKPYKCSICGKGFIQSNNLSTHMKIHTGEKPHSCTVRQNFFFFNFYILSIKQ
jgi:uncharacterized Zn-finger protein